MSPHHSYQMSQRSQVSWVVLWRVWLLVVSEVSPKGQTKLTIELFWTAKNNPRDFPWALPTGISRVGLERQLLSVRYGFPNTSSLVFGGEGIQRCYFSWDITHQERCLVQVPKKASRTKGGRRALLTDLFDDVWQVPTERFPLNLPDTDTLKGFRMGCFRNKKITKHGKGDYKLLRPFRKEFHSYSGHPYDNDM